MNAYTITGYKNGVEVDQLTCKRKTLKSVKVSVTRYFRGAVDKIEVIENGELVAVKSKGKWA